VSVAPPPNPHADVSRGLLDRERCNKEDLTPSLASIVSGGAPAIERPRASQACQRTKTWRSGSRGAHHPGTARRVVAFPMLASRAAQEDPCLFTRCVLLASTIDVQHPDAVREMLDLDRLLEAAVRSQDGHAWSCELMPGDAERVRRHGAYLRAHTAGGQCAPSGVASAGESWGM
jgi:hypothetical protein